MNRGMGFVLAPSPYNDNVFFLLDQISGLPILTLSFDNTLPLNTDMKQVFLNTIVSSLCDSEEIESVLGDLCYEVGKH